MTQSTIVLVHGALTGSSIWSSVIEQLQEQDHTVIAPAMPLRSLKSDVQYLAALLDTVDSSVVLAGHSYGGTVISHPEFDRSSVTGLVFVSAFAPDTNESTGELNGRWPGSKLGEATTVTRPYPGGTDLYLRPECFEDVYAGGLEARIVARMAASQRPIDVAALGASIDGTPAWRNRPSYFLVSTEDTSLVPAAQRFMAQRAEGTVIEVPASHASPLSHPDVVAELITQAAKGG